MRATVRVEGLRELQRDLKRADQETAKRFRAGLKEVGDPVQEEATDRGSRYRGIGRFVVRARMATVTVEQSARTVTGERGDFGVLQMRTVLEPALDDRQDEVVERFERLTNEIIDSANL